MSGLDFSRIRVFENTSVKNALHPFNNYNILHTKNETNQMLDTDWSRYVYSSIGTLNIDVFWDFDIIPAMVTIQIFGPAVLSPSPINQTFTQIVSPVPV